MRRHFEEPGDAVDIDVLRRLPRPLSGAVEDDDVDSSFDLDDPFAEELTVEMSDRAVRGDEFTCRNCHLVLHISHGRSGGYCHDCA